MTWNPETDCVFYGERDECAWCEADCDVCPYDDWGEDDERTDQRGEWMKTRDTGWLHHVMGLPKIGRG